MSLYFIWQELKNNMSNAYVNTYALHVRASFGSQVSKKCGLGEPTISFNAWTIVRLSTKPYRYSLYQHSACFFAISWLQFCLSVISNWNKIFDVQDFLLVCVPK